MEWDQLLEHMRRESGQPFLSIDMKVSAGSKGLVQPGEFLAAIRQAGHLEALKESKHRVVGNHGGRCPNKRAGSHGDPPVSQEKVPAKRPPAG